jgi:uncharacterized protein with von Willebrand factor type A (vWA) domain
MKRIVRLTESDLTRIVRRVIKENNLAESEEEAISSEIESMDEDTPDPGLLQKLENFAKNFKKLPKRILNKIKRLKRKNPNMIKRYPNIDMNCPDW